MLLFLPMERLQDPYLWLFLIVGMIWLYRARRALKSLRLIPVIEKLSYSLSSEPKITVILPARNEESNIAECLSQLRNQDYANIQVIIINDQSTDKTESLLRSLGVQQLSDTDKKRADLPAVAYLNTTPTPEGWTGKNYAIHSAMDYARGEWYLFTDADTRHDSQSIGSALQHALLKDISFLTLIPRCKAVGLMEKIVQPVAMCFLGLWFPIEEANDAKSKTIFGNGQYILMTKKCYRSIGGHIRVKGEFLEDYGLMRESKQLNYRTECASGVDIYETRMYDSLDSMWRGWRRIYLHAFLQKPSKLLSKALSVLAFSIIPFFVAIDLTRLALEYPDHYGFSWGISIAILLFIIGTSWKAFATVKANGFYSIFHPIASFFISLFLLDAFWIAFRKKETTWR